MVRLPTLNTLIAQRFVSANGVYLPANKAIDYVRGSCTPVWVRNSDINFPYSFKGSSFLCKHRRRYFCVLTAHQLTGHKPDEVFFSLRETTNILIRGSDCASYTRNERTSQRYDLCVMLLPLELVVKHKDQKTLFFDTLGSWSELDGREYIFALVACVTQYEAGAAN